MRNRMLLGLAGSMLLVAACAPAPEEAAEPAAAKVEDPSGIHSVRDKYAAAENAGDAAAVAALWTADGVLMPANAPAAQGNQAIQAFYEGQFGQAKAELTVTGEETVIFGDWGFDRGKFALTLTMTDGSVVEDQGKYVVLLARQPDASWKVARLIFNSDLPLPGAAAPAGGGERKKASP